MTHTSRGKGGSVKEGGRAWHPGPAVGVLSAPCARLLAGSGAGGSALRPAGLGLPNLSSWGSGVWMHGACHGDLDDLCWVG